MNEKAVQYVYDQYINKYLTSIKYFFLHNPPANFRLFPDINKSVFKSCSDAYGMSLAGIKNPE